MMALFDPNGEFWLIPLGADSQGTIGELGRNFWTGVIEAFPDIDNTVDKVTADFAGITNNKRISTATTSSFAVLTRKTGLWR